MTVFCTYHCRECDGHFTSLEAFDAHRSGPPQERVCSYPDDAGLVERKGKCHISVVRDRSNVTIYETERSARARKHFDSTV